MAARNTLNWNVYLNMAKNKWIIIPPIGRFIDPLTDFGFKRIFGSEPNKDLLIAFLNELFNGRKIIKDLVYNSQEQNGPAAHFRKSIFDLTCTGADGETFIIEMQRASQKYFIDRAIYYAASKIHEQGAKGKASWDFELKEVYFIALMDFNFDHSPPEKYLHWIHLTEEETGNTFYQKLGFAFLELPNFNLAENEINTDLERWFFVLRNMNRMNKIPVILRKKIFLKLFQIAEVAGLKKVDYMSYEKDLLDRWTEYSVLKTAEERGIEKGIEKGKREVVENLLTTKEFKLSKIAAIAGVTESFVKKVQDSMKKKK